MRISSAMTPEKVAELAVEAMKRLIEHDKTNQKIMEGRHYEEKKAEH